MKENFYSYTFKAKCPSDGSYAEYSLLIKHDDFIFCEDIVAACDFGDTQMFHEHIADMLAKKLPGRQQISAEHCGVEVTTVR